MMYKHWETQKKALLEIIAKGQCATCQVCYGTNYSIFFRNAHSDLLLKKNIIPVYVDLNHIDVLNLKNLYNLVLASVKRTLVEKRMSGKFEAEYLAEDAAIARIKAVLEELTGRNLSVVFFFEDVDVLFKLTENPFLLFEHINVSYPKCSFIYLVKRNMSHPKNLSSFNKASHMYENIIYLPVRSEASLKFVEKGMTAKVFNTIYSLTGGVDKFHSIAIDLKNNLSPRKKKFLANYISENWSLKKEMHTFWDSLSLSEVNVLAQIVWGCEKFEDDFERDLNHLIKLGLVQETKSGFKIVIGLLKTIGIEKSINSNMKVELMRNKVFINGKEVSVKLSDIEKKVLKQLLDNKNKIVNRMLIAKSIWNGSHKRKYSDVVIDTTVSKIKNKLSDLWVNPNNLVSIQDRGFIYKEAS